jgi:hypothetical protein
MENPEAIFPQHGKYFSTVWKTGSEGKEPE